MPLFRKKQQPTPAVPATPDSAMSPMQQQQDQAFNNNNNNNSFKSLSAEDRQKIVMDKLIAMGVDSAEVASLICTSSSLSDTTMLKLNYLNTEYKGIKKFVRPHHYWCSVVCICLFRKTYTYIELFWRFFFVFVFNIWTMYIVGAAR